ncbi:MAG: hypothetical protein K8R86_07550, partial [Bacteroidales bacterium]|nr:hypothetical protein [Bacteroidales bacterium]
YALYAEEAGYSDDGDWTILGDNIYSAVPGNVGIGTQNPITPLHVHGQGAFGNTVNSTKANRALNLIATDAVMRIWRTTDNTAFDPGVEIIWGNQPSQGDEGNFWWDFHLKGSDGSFNIRDRSFGQGNETRLAIDTSGNVGLGTTTPDERLHIAGALVIEEMVSGSLSDSLVTWDPVSNKLNVISMSSFVGGDNDWTLDGDTLYSAVDSTITIKGGNVGIGTPIPSSRLTLGGDDPHITFDASGSSHSMGLRFSHNGTVKYQWAFDEPSGDINFDWDMDDTGTGDILFKRHGDDRLAIRNNGDIQFKRYGDPMLAIRGSDGNVGIGTSNPNSILTIAGDDPYLTFDASATSHEMGMNFSHNGILKYTWSFDEPSNDITFDWDLDDAGSGDILFKKYGDDRLAIRNNGDVQFKRYGDPMLAIRGIDGNVGIGTSAPFRRLTITGEETDIRLDINSGSPTPTEGLEFAMDGIDRSSIQYEKSTNNLVIEFDKDNSGLGDIQFKRHGDDRLAIRNDGNVGIGTSTPTRTLDVNGEVKIGMMNLNNTFENIVVADMEGVLHIRDAATLGGGTPSLWAEMGPDIHNINPGNVGIGTPMPTHTLDVMGEARIEIMNMNNTLNNVVVADEFGVLHIRDAFTLGGFSKNIKDVLRLEPRNTYPANPEEGDIFVNANDHNIYCYLNGEWKQLNN